MSIFTDKFFLPDKFLKTALPRGFWNRTMLTRNVDPKQTVIKTIVTATAVTKRELDGTYRRAIKFYDDKMARLEDEGIKAYKRDALHNEELLKARLKQLIVWNEVQVLKKEHKGQYYRWLPSGAKEPRPEHQLLYGKIFKVGEGDSHGFMPGEDWGCQCGIEWLDEADIPKKDRE